MPSTLLWLLLVYTNWLRLALVWAVLPPLLPPLLLVLALVLAAAGDRAAAGDCGRERPDSRSSSEGPLSGAAVMEGMLPPGLQGNISPTNLRASVADLQCRQQSTHDT